MKNCEECKEGINEKDLPFVFQISIGEIKDGMFYGSKPILYHKECFSKTDLQ